MSAAAPRSLFGLRVHSELPLTDLPPAGADGDRVDVRFGDVAPHDEHVQIGVNGALSLNIPAAGRFLVSAGDDIVIDPAPGASERELRVFLLGSAFGALLHQRGLLPLHANSIGIGGKAVAFLGRSGAGKSTLAHWFQRRDHPVLADDVSAIALDGAPTALPGVPRLRLWEDALQAAGLGDHDFPRSFDGHDKFDVPAVRPPSRRAMPLAACYLLAEADQDDSARVTRLTGIEAFEALIANTYRGQFVPLLGASERHLEACIRLAREVPIFRATRRWGVDRFEQEAAALKDHAEQLIRNGSAAREAAAVNG